MNRFLNRDQALCLFETFEEEDAGKSSDNEIDHVSEDEEADPEDEPMDYFDLICMDEGNSSTETESEDSFQLNKENQSLNDAFLSNTNQNHQITFEKELNTILEDISGALPMRIENEINQNFASLEGDNRAFEQIFIEYGIEDYSASITTPHVCNSRIEDLSLGNSANTAAHAQAEFDLTAATNANQTFVAASTSRLSHHRPTTSCTTTTVTPTVRIGRASPAQVRRLNTNNQSPLSSPNLARRGRGRGRRAASSGRGAGRITTQSSESSSNPNPSSSNSNPNNSYHPSTDYLARRNKQTYTWKKDPNFFDVQTEPTLRKLAVSDQLKDITNKFEFFDQIIDDTFVDKTIEYSNIRLAKKGEEPLTRTELRGFFGLLLLFGVTKKNEIDTSELWSHNSIHCFDWAIASMSRHRFQTLCSSICFYDERIWANKANTQRTYYKVEELVEIFRKNISRAAIPGEFLTVDEQLPAFRGKCPFRQYLPKKPSKYGIKWWTICDASTGYCLDTKIYLGSAESSKQTKRYNLNLNVASESNVTSSINVASDSNSRSKSCFSVSEDVVLSLSERYIDSDRTITADNLFTTVHLAEELWDRGLKYVGTMRKNKSEIPQEFQPKTSRPVFSSVFGFNHNLTLTSYVPKTNKAVVLLSTLHHDSSVENTLSKKPSIITFYNSTKGGVDRLDQCIENYTCRRKNNRWSMHTLFNELDIGAYNAYVLAKTAMPHEFKETEKDRRLYLEGLAQFLLRPLVDERNKKASMVNYSGKNRFFLESIRRIGFMVTRRVIHSNSNQRERCSFCERKKDNKTSNKCCMCSTENEPVWVCAKHSQKQYVCNACLNLPIE